MVFELMKKDENIIKVIGVGGGGSNAVNFMYEKGIVGVDFAICNTDSQALEESSVPVKIQLGPALTEGNGAGSKPKVGRDACMESVDEVVEYLKNGTKMVFITAGMGGGTGTGAAPVIAKIAKDQDILTVAIVTVPFSFEGPKRKNHSKDGLAELRKNVDAIIIISNDKLKLMYGNFKLSKAFEQADSILATAAKSIAEIITVPGQINVDFEDVKTVITDSGRAVMGTATAEGDDRARVVVETALNSPLLEDSDITGSQHILLSITSGTKEVTLDEITEITDYIQAEVGEHTDVIWGNAFDETLGESLRITIIATGFEKDTVVNVQTEDKRNIVDLDYDEGAESIYEGGFSDITSNNVYEFDDFKTGVRKPKIYTNHLNQEISIKQRSKSKESGLGVRRVKTMPTNEEFMELENIPAYERKKVNLDEVNHSSNEPVSRMTISDDGTETYIKTDNQFLHDNAD